MCKLSECIQINSFTRASHNIAHYCAAVADAPRFSEHGPVLLPVHIYGPYMGSRQQQQKRMHTAEPTTRRIIISIMLVSFKMKPKV